MVKSNKILDITINGACTVKVLDFEGKRNISGERIRLARLECKYSQQALAAKVQTVGVILEQTPSAELKTAQEWCRIMNSGRWPASWEEHGRLLEIEE